MPEEGKDAHSALSRGSGGDADALAAAESVLTAFYQQDQRELQLIRGDAEAAARAESRANDRMAAAFAAEFPDLDEVAAARAGSRFMHALYLQDEIENWEYIDDQRTDPAIDELLYSSRDVEPAARQSRDPRWERVERYLEDVCACAGIEAEYAPLQTRFWKLHDQVEDYWRQDALEAHRVKLRSMLPEAEEQVIEQLAATFVEGVTLHDRWDHQNRERDLRDVRELVTDYYRTVFDVRGGRP